MYSNPFFNGRRNATPKPHLHQVAQQTRHFSQPAKPAAHIETKRAKPVVTTNCRGNFGSAPGSLA